MDDYCFCDYEMPEFCHIELRKARKEHRCDECGRIIERGDTYENVHGKWDGRLDTFKTCSRCLALKEWVRTHVPCFCWAYGNVREDALETARSYADQAPGLLFGAYRREVAIRRGRKFNDGKESAWIN